MAAIASTDGYPFMKGDCDGYKIVHAGYNFCERPQTFSDCLHRAESTAAFARCVTVNMDGFVSQVLKILLTEEPEEAEPRNDSESDEPQPDRVKERAVAPSKIVSFIPQVPETPFTEM